MYIEESYAPQVAIPLDYEKLPATTRLGFYIFASRMWCPRVQLPVVLEAPGMSRRQRLESVEKREALDIPEVAPSTVTGSSEDEEDMLDDSEMEF